MDSRQIRTELHAAQDVQEKALPCTRTTTAGERVEIVACEFHGALPLLVAASGARYADWATWGGLTRFDPELHLSDGFLHGRLAELERDIEALLRGRARVASNRQVFLSAMAPLEIDAVCIRSQLKAAK
jgi:hypothetical protein